MSDRAEEFERMKKESELDAKAKEITVKINEEKKESWFKRNEYKISWISFFITIIVTIPALITLSINAYQILQTLTQIKQQNITFTVYDTTKLTDIVEYLIERSYSSDIIKKYCNKINVGDVVNITEAYVTCHAGNASRDYPLSIRKYELGCMFEPIIC